MTVSGIKIAKRHEEETELQTQIQNLIDLKAQAESAAKHYEEAQEQFIKEMERVGRKTLADGVHKATVTERSVPKYDERGLAKALGATLWNKITKKSLDKVKLEKAIDEGEIDINVVAQHATVTPSKPYLRFSAVTPDE